MTTQNRFSDRNRDQQDGYERGMWGELEYVPGAGAVMKVRGTGVEGGTLDEEVPLVNTGYGFNVASNYNTEVIMFSVNSDTNQKMVVPTLPRDKQRQWPVNTGGVQHPTNPEKFVQLDNDRIWLKDGSFALGDNQELKITISGGNVTIETAGEIDIKSSKLTHNGINIGDNHVHAGIIPGPADTLGPKDP